MSLKSSTKPEQEIKDFPWQNVKFSLDQDGNFNVNDDVMKVWNEYGFFIIKDLFTKKIIESLDRCTQDPNIQTHLQPRVDKDGYKINFLVWNNCDNGLIGACTRCHKVATTMEKLLGGEVYHYHTKVALKDGNGGGGFNWHQDYGYWYKNGCLTPDIATLWLPLDHVDEQNGCLKLIPGSHKLGRIEHINIKNQVTADPERIYHLLNRFGFIYAKMNAGDGLFFHSNVLHSSESNWSTKRRWAIISSYNMRSNDPVYKHHHPNYYPLEQLNNNDVDKFLDKFATDYKFQNDEEDKSLQDGYNEDNRRDI